MKKNQMTMGKFQIGYFVSGLMTSVLIFGLFGFNSLPGIVASSYTAIWLIPMVLPGGIVRHTKLTISVAWIHFISAILLIVLAYIPAAFPSNETSFNRVGAPIHFLTFLGVTCFWVVIPWGYVCRRGLQALRIKFAEQGGASDR